MRKKNTKIGMAIGYIALVISGILAAIGAVADIFGFAQGVSENKESILGVFGTVLSFLVHWWKWVLIFAAIVVFIIFRVRLAQKKELEDRKTRNLSWFDAQRRNTKYSGGEEYLYELKRFFKQDEAGLSWWAVTGVAGMGKTRLVIEALRDRELTNADVQWIEYFDDYREDALKARVDEILGQPNLRKIIIAEDAQIYMDNIGVLLGYIAEKPATELGKHKIRVLLVIRMGENEDLTDRYKQLASKTRQSVLQKTRFNTFKEELRISKYNEEDIEQIVKTYMVNTKKNRKKEKALPDDQVAEIQTKTIQLLKSENMDPGHLRPLFAMFIADAMLEGRDPKEWDLISVLEYAVIEREEEFLQLEARDIQKNDNFRVFDKIRSIVCLSFIRNGIALSELDDIREELEEELRHVGISLKDFLREMQLLGDDGIIRLSVPDILSEYYVIRFLVIKPEKSSLEWLIKQLCTSLSGAEEFRQKIRQDFRFLYDEIEEGLDDFYYAFFEQCSSDLAFKIVKITLSEMDLRDSNDVLLHEAIGNQIRNKANEETLSVMLFNMITDAPEMEEKRSCLSELQRLAEENAGSAKIVLEYSKGLYNIIFDAPEMEEKRSYLDELKRLAEENAGSAEILLVYCDGLVNMIFDAPELEEKRSCLSELKRLAGENARSAEIVLTYCNGLFNMIIYAPELEEKRSCLSELKHLAEENAEYIKVASEYSSGLYNMFILAPELEEKRSCLTELKRLAGENAGSTEIVLSYSEGLFNMLNDAPELEEKRICLSELKRLAGENAGSTEIVLRYSKGLFNMLNDAPELEEKRNFLSELKRLARENAGSGEILFEYSEGLFNMLFDAPELEERRNFLTELKRLAGENAGSPEIVVLYGKGLFFILNRGPELEEKRSCLTELKRLAEENAGSPEIVLEYSKALFNMRQFDEEHYDNCIAELYRILSNKELAQYIAKNEPDIITYTRRELLDYEYENGSGDIKTTLNGIL